MTTLAAVVENEATRHELPMWCDENDLPDARLKGVEGVNLAWCIAVATDLLYTLSGRQYRNGRSVVRPVSMWAGYGTQSYLYPYSSMSGYGAAWGFAAGWAWTALGMGWWQNGQDLTEVRLQGPVRRINNVMVDGVSLGGWPPTNPNFTLYDKRRLIRNVDTLGMTAGAWPWNQQLQLALDQPGTWMIDYEWGKPPPPSGRMACAELSIELARAFGGGENNLPARVLSVNTEGVSLAVGDALTFLREELTGLPIVDQFLQAKNPGKLRRRSVFLSPNSVVHREMEGFPNS